LFVCFFLLNWVGVYLELLFITSNKKKEFCFQVIGYHLVLIQIKGKTNGKTCHPNKRMLKRRKTAKHVTQTKEFSNGEKTRQTAKHVTRSKGFPKGAEQAEDEESSGE
jgi:hypothetical protein